MLLTMINYEFRWEYVFDPPWSDMLLQGLSLTIFLTVVTTVTSFIFGAVLAAGSLSRNYYISIPSKSCVEVLRNVPGVFWLIIWFMMVPMLFPEDIQNQINGFEYYGIFAAVMGLTFNNSPYVSDILKSGYQSLHPEFLYSIKIQGFTKVQSWRMLVLPQLIISLFPIINTRMVHNIKNTSLAMVISVPELTWQSQEIESISFAGLESTIAVTLIYVLLAMIMSGIFNYLELVFKNRYNSHSVLHDSC